MSQTATIPSLISVDDHLIEPPHLWESRLPAKYRETGPRVRIAPRGEMSLDNGVWKETPGTGDEMAAWWQYEDHLYQLKQIIACPGIPPEDVKAIGVTFDDIARGCFEPKSRIADMEANSVEASLCFPNYPRFCGQLFSERKDKTLSKLGVGRSRPIEKLDLSALPAWSFLGMTAGDVIPVLNLCAERIQESQEIAA